MAFKMHHTSGLQFPTTNDKGDEESFSITKKLIRWGRAEEGRKQAQEKEVVVGDVPQGEKATSASRERAHEAQAP
jgi:hypothetical protein